MGKAVCILLLALIAISMAATTVMAANVRYNPSITVPFFKPHPNPIPLPKPRPNPIPGTPKTGPSVKNAKELYCVYQCLRKCGKTQQCTYHCGRCCKKYMVCPCDRPNCT